MRSTQSTGTNQQFLEGPGAASDQRQCITLVLSRSFKASQHSRGLRCLGISASGREGERGLGPGPPATMELVLQPEALLPYSWRAPRRALYGEKQ